jgi:signal transduction histidine kinase
MTMYPDKLEDIIKDCDTNKLKSFYENYRNRLHELLVEYFISDYNITDRYHEFVLNQEEGRGRVNTYIELFGECLSGSVDGFFDDQEKIGGARAVQGYALEDVVGFVRAFGQALWQCIKEYNRKESDAEKQINFNDTFYIYQLSAASNYMISVGFNKSANDVIKVNRDRIYRLQRYAAETVSVFDEIKVYDLAIECIKDLFGLRAKLLIIDNIDVSSKMSSNHSVERVHSFFPSMPHILELIKKDKNIIVRESPDAFTGSDNRLLGILLLNDGERQFDVAPMQAYLLGQFGFLTGAIISNCRMTSEIADQQKELRELAGRLISIQEDERKKIAAEIHDTVTQSLTGIGYKAQFCQEIIDKYPEKLEDELNNLVVNIGHAIRQSRQLIKALRPQVLDGVGVTAALKSLINEFYEDSLIAVDFSYPENISVGQHQEITIFRIVQEALRCN